eukprot:3079513-Prorocentrum_lima.AAC.1
MVRAGPDSSFRTRFVSRRSNFVHGLIRAEGLTVEYVASDDNAADALTKGLGVALHRKARFLLCLPEQEQ